MTTPRPRKFVAVVIGFLLSSVLALAAPIKFEIPAQPAPAALKAFVKQSSQQVVFNPADLEGVNANEVIGSFEPAAALDALLKGTGFNATKGKGGIFMVKKADVQATTGSLRGSLTGEGGKGAPNVLVSIRETSQSTETDKYGVYAFPNVAAGSYVLVASASGYQTLHITDVNVKAGRELTLGKEEMRKAPEGVLKLEPFVVHADTVEQLEKFEVTGSKQKPFQDANVDIPRTINDTQAYYIFDSKTIEQSGAFNVEDFLKQRLSMNAIAQTQSQFVASYGSGQSPSRMGVASTVNLRGLGADKTLILINGRKTAGAVNINTSGAAGFDINSAGQPNLNGIPLSAIDRIEVLPTSASGIYGGSALGGVVNVILKKSYSGGELKLTYDNTWNSDSPRRTASLIYGRTFNNGKTSILISAAFDDAAPLLLADRREFVDRGLAYQLRIAPDLVDNAQQAALGALPNIKNANGSFAPTAGGSYWVPQPLILKSGATLSSGVTFISAGISGSASQSARDASLVGNAGSINRILPPTIQPGFGLAEQITTASSNKSIGVTVSHDINRFISASVDYSHNENRGHLEVMDPGAYQYLIPASSIYNPFTTSVNITVPMPGRPAIASELQSDMVSLGVHLSLPHSWQVQSDFTWSRTISKANGVFGMDPALSTDLSNGVINPFVDTIQFPLDIEKYQSTFNSLGSKSITKDFALRGSGPLGRLPWGFPNLNIGLDRLVADLPPAQSYNIFPVTTSSSSFGETLSRRSITDSAFAEISIPVVKKHAIPLISELEIQLAGRIDNVTVTGGTPSKSTKLATGVVTYASPTLGGQPFVSESDYEAKNGTYGIKYSPIESIIIRGSYSSAFLPPKPSQLIKNAVINPTTSSVTDPKNNGARFSVQTISGGNPDLKPQNANSTNVGIVWLPTISLLRGLRLDAEYYHIIQFDAINSLSAQVIVNNESLFQDRVVRDSTGALTFVDTSLLNLYKRETEGWDLSADYSKETTRGTISIHAVQTIALHLKNQVSLTTPNNDAVGIPSEGGAARYKGSLTVTWEKNKWQVGLSSQYVGSYKQFGAAGGPTSRSVGNGLPFPGILTLQGDKDIPAQVTHDLFVAYAFKGPNINHESRQQVSAKVFDGLTIQVGVRNIFNTMPPYDAFYPFYISPFGDARLRTYWLSLKRAF